MTRAAEARTAPPAAGSLSTAAAGSPPAAAGSPPAAGSPRAAAPRHAAAAQLPADALYGRLLATAVQHRLGAGPAPRGRVRLADGRLEALPLDRWLAPADATDEAILADVAGPVLDLGCGPGRHLAHLRAAGKAGLGVDLSPVAVRLARGRGADAIPGSLWTDLPGGATWQTVLLLDGNIGIGGAPAALLRRAGELLSADGCVLVETDPPGAPTRRVRVRLEAPGMVSEWFRWARVGADGIDAIARRSGFAVESRRSLGARTFVTLRRR